MTNQEERLKEFVLSVTYGGRGNDLDDTLPVSEFEKQLKAFIQSEIDLALANRNKEIVENMVSIVTGHHCVARKSYHKDSWDAGYHDALFAIEKSLVNLITKDNE